MTEFRRLTALLLVLLLAASACSETTTAENPADDPAAPAAAEEAVPEETSPEEDIDARKAVPDDLPEKDMDGYTFRILTRDRSDFVEDVGLEKEEKSSRRSFFQILCPYAGRAHKWRSLRDLCRSRPSCESPRPDEFAKRTRSVLWTPLVLEVE